MTPQLRKAHRYIWFSLAVLLPLGWLASILAIPDEIWQQPVRPVQPAQMPRLVRSKSSGDFLLNLREDSAGMRRQVEIFVKKPLNNPNTVAAAGANGEILLGLLGTRGVSRFDLDSLTARENSLIIRLEDRIQGRLLRTVDLGKE